MKINLYTEMKAEKDRERERDRVREREDKRETKRGRENKICISVVFMQPNLMN